MSTSLWYFFVDEVSDSVDVLSDEVVATSGLRLAFPVAFVGSMRPGLNL